MAKRKPKKNGHPSKGVRVKKLNFSGRKREFLLNQAALNRKVKAEKRGARHD